MDVQGGLRYESKKESLDIRTLCSQHAKEMIYAKYALIRTNKQDKSECDKCMRQGYEYILIKRK